MPTQIIFWGPIFFIFDDFNFVNNSQFQFKGSASEDYQDEFDFVKILQLIERMESQLASYRLQEKTNCNNKLFEICQIFENYRNSLQHQGIANSDDELLNEMINEAR